MKKNYILIMISIFALILIGVGCYFYYQNNSKKQEKPKEEEEITTPFSGKETEISDTLKELTEKLTTLGEKIYDEGSYTSYEKKNEIYFISLEEIKTQFQYDISVFKDENGNICDTKESGIYFDIENKTNQQYDENYKKKNTIKPVIPILIGCGVEENEELKNENH